MARILVMTVGGSDKPMVKSIKEINPDHIFFICSSGRNSSRIMVEGEGMVCKADHSNDEPRPNILIQTGFPKENTDIFEVDPDDPYAVYDLSKNIISEHKDHVVFADYTPGTKSMSAGLFLAASEFEHCTPILVKGPRLNLVKVAGDRSRVSRINRNRALVSRYKDAFYLLLDKQDYVGARKMIDAISILGEEEEDQEFLDRATLAIGAFDLWDRFQFARAYTELAEFCMQFSPDKTMIEYKIAAGRIAGIVEWLKNEASDTRTAPGSAPHTVKNPWKEVPLPVYDLIRNAERRARMEQYDDAAARLYRATELYAQFALRRRDIFTSNITENTLKQLPAEHRERLELKRDAEGKLAVGLFESYELLSGLGEPIGQVWETYKTRIKDVIKIRNLSWLAHGFEPVSREDYEKFHRVLSEFIRQCDEADPHYRKSKINLNNYPDLPNTDCFMN